MRFKHVTLVLYTGDFAELSHTSTYCAYWALHLKATKVIWWLRDTTGAWRDTVKPTECLAMGPYSRYHHNDGEAPCR